MNAFEKLKIINPIIKALDSAGYNTPTPIQQMAIPPLLEGKDLLGCAQTGTGKTAAFAIPILQLHFQNRTTPTSKCPSVLVLVPTRELAIQVKESFIAYGKFLNMNFATVFGGVGQSPQVKALIQGVDVLVATPGRLLDLINQKHVFLKQLQFFVLDEADRMLDMGFINDIKKIIKLIPAQTQNLFFSASMPPQIENLAYSILRDPVKIAVNPISSTVDKISQSVLFVNKENKLSLLKHLLKKSEFKKVIVFSRTKHGANKIVDQLLKVGINSDAIHGNKSQSARQQVLEKFRKSELEVLVATDIAARGIDIDDITHVINFDLPNESESYVHRIGRTARAGASGHAISFCDVEEKAFLKDVEKLIKKSIPIDKNHPYHNDEIIHAKTIPAGKAKALIDSRNKFNHQRNRFSKRIR